jgi:predicted MPP superfamily phosphohydrolase
VGGVVLVLGLVRPLRPTRSGAAAAAALVALAVVGLYATHVEPRWLRVDRAELDVAAVDEADPIRIGVLADLQTDGFDGHEERAVDRLLAQDPDLILLAGDYFQSDGPDFFAALPELRALLARLEAPGGVFLVEGDIDSPERMAFMTEGIEQLRWLDEEVVTTEVRGQVIRIGGISVRYDAPEAQATIDELVSAPAADEVRILLSHRPDAAFDVPPGGVDLVVSGHTHGGQVQVPFFGPPIKLSNVSREVAAGGLHDIDGVPIYLSTGVGMERATAPQVRFLARPSIGVVTLR